VSEELLKLQNAVERSGEAIFITDREGFIQYANPEFSRLYGYRKEEIIGKQTPRILKSGKLSRSDYEKFWNSILNKKIFKGEWVNKCKDGREIDVEGSASPLLNDIGEIIGFLAIQRDITSRKRYEQELIKRNRELAVLNAVTSAISQTLDLGEIINIALDEVLQLEMLGDEVYGMLFLAEKQSDSLSLMAERGAPVDHPCLVRPPKKGECVCGLAYQEGITIISESCWKDERHTRRWRNMPAHKDIAIPLKFRGKCLGVMDIRIPDSKIMAEDDVELLESVAAQVSIAIENAQLRELRQRAIIEERERIARELHDEFLQLLGYVNTKAMAVRLMLLNKQFDDAEKNLVQIEEASRSMFVDMRSAILGLQLAGQTGDGLIQNLVEYVDHYSKLTGLPITVSHPEEAFLENLDPEEELQLFRIVQEALNNVYKHASANNALIMIDHNSKFFRLIIRDDGKGFSPQEDRSHDRSHFGLRMMRERANAIGAEFEIDSGPGSGTSVMVCLTH